MRRRRVGPERPGAAPGLMPGANGAGGSAAVRTGPSPRSRTTTRVPPRGRWSPRPRGAGRRGRWQRRPGPPRSSSSRVDQARIEQLHSGRGIPVRVGAGVEEGTLSRPATGRHPSLCDRPTNTSPGPLPEKQTRPPCCPGSARPRCTDTLTDAERRPARPPTRHRPSSPLPPHRHPTADPPGESTPRSRGGPPVGGTPLPRRPGAGPPLRPRRAARSASMRSTRCVLPSTTVGCSRLPDHRMPIRQSPEGLHIEQRVRFGLRVRLRFSDRARTRP